MSLESYFTYFEQLLETVYSSFLDINWINTDTGYELTRKDQQGRIGNFVVHTQSTGISEEEINKLSKSFEILYCPSTANVPKLSPITELAFYERNYLKMRTPIPDGFSVQSFSFNSRRRGVHLVFEKLNLLPMSDFMNIPTDNHKAFERFPRGLLHTFSEAKFWVLEDSSENIISLAITVIAPLNGNDVQSIWYLVTQANMRNKAFGKFMLETILAHTKKNTKTILLGYYSPALQSMMNAYNFEKIGSLNIFKL